MEGGPHGKKMKRVAIIPARGGSKRIPKKNIMDFFGKPMIAYTIEAAIVSQLFDSVIVSTDDEKIAAVALEYGAEVPFMRDEHADDHANVSQVVAYTLGKLQQDLGKTYDTACMLMANCPIRSSEDIINAMQIFDDSETKFQISAFEYGWMNPWWAHKLDEQNKATPVFEKATKSRSQDLSDLYCPTGAIWIAESEALVKSKTFYGPEFTFCAVDWKSAVDIDDYKDLDMAKAIFLLKKNRID